MLVLYHDVVLVSLRCYFGPGQESSHMHTPDCTINLPLLKILCRGKYYKKKIVHSYTWSQGVRESGCLGVRVSTWGVRVA